ncbi:MAG TPA: thioredoxin domain-containing protein [Anaeromyxobacteraceae bacterium]|nr:thioredoxin domain-containing protein [Anaeromyxobacteraceae bacterium]
MTARIPAGRRWLPLLALLAAAACQRGGPGRAEARGTGESRGTDPALPGLTGDPTLGAKLAGALAAKGPAYRPRTRHLLPDGAPRYTNRLILESSPYLLQHAHNPVSWYAWGDEPFERARREGKPVFLSIGYATCHWCHVMEEESFEDEEIARYLNEHFVAIKVDREERPGVDAVYLRAVVMMAGSGGWPATLLLTPDRLPFFAGTYFPARDGERQGMTGLLSILREASAVQAEHPERLAEVTKELAQRLAARAPGPGAGALPGPEAIAQAVASLGRAYDAANGGFGGAPKFPMPAALALLARSHQRTRDARTLEMLEHTLAAMAAGGIHDQLGGGFHRYATDDRWLVPHFEKMLYDNAQLAVVYLEAFQLTGREDFARVARDTLDALDRELSDPAGGFASATDADSPGPDGRREEGRFFTWTPREVEAVLGRDRARAAIAWFGVSSTGPVGGRSVLHTPASLEATARTLKVGATELRGALARARQDLYQARAKRPPPARDDAVVAAWNGLAVSALSRASQVLSDAGYAARAVRAAEFLLRDMSAGGRLRRSWRGGAAGTPGTLDDHAFVAQGLLDLYEATHDPRWLEAATAVAEQLERHFADPAGGYFLTADDDEAPLGREKPAEDGAEPAGNSVAALDLLRLAELRGDDRWRRRAERLLAAFAPQLQDGSLPAMLSALDFALGQPLEIVVVAPAPGGAAAFEEAQRRIFAPNRSWVVATEGEDLAAQARLVPLLEGKRAQGGKATAYVCRARVCDLPTTDPRLFAAQLARAASRRLERP